MTTALAQQTSKARPAWFGTVSVRAGLTAVALVINLVVVAAFFVRFGAHRPGSSGLGLGGYRIDLDVYRLGARHWFDGGAPYGQLPKTHYGAKVLFSYPPAAILSFLPLAILSYGAANVVLTSLSLAAVGLTCWLYLTVADSRRPLRMLLSIGPLALLLEPVRDTVLSGQVNAVLMGLIAWDCLAYRAGFTSWRSGWLVGIAAAVKLTPAIFLLYFLARRDWAALRRLALGFAAFQAAAAIVDPVTSLQYWSRIVFQTGRIGPPQYAANQSLLGLIARLGVTGSARTEWWLGLSALVLALAVPVIRTAVRTGQLLSALTVNALVALLVCPISWSHQWVWAVPALLTLAVSGGTHRIVGFTGVLLLAVAPQALVPRDANLELRWTWWQPLAGSSYCLVGIATLLVLTLRLLRPLRLEPSLIASAELPLEMAS